MWKVTAKALFLWCLNVAMITGAAFLVGVVVRFVVFGYVWGYRLTSNIL